MHNSENSQTSKYNIQKLSWNNLILYSYYHVEHRHKYCQQRKKNKNEQERNNFRLEETFVPFPLAL
jgi:hypothetical protein